MTVTINSSSPMLARATPARPRVLIFDHTAILGGGEIALLNLVAALRDSPYDVQVLLGSQGPLVEKLTSAGITPHILEIDPEIVHTRKDSLGAGSALKLRKLTGVFSYARRLARFLRDQRIDLLHTNSLKSDVIGAIAARRAGVPVIWHVRDRICREYLPRAAVMGFRGLARVLPTALLANSNATLATLPKRRNRFVAHDGVPGLPEIVPAGAGPNGLAADGRIPSPLIGIVGRISPWKGQHIFIAAAAEVVKKYPAARFQIVGSALFNERDYENQIRSQVRQLGLENTVEFTGFRSDVDACIARMDIVVHASTIGEPFGQVVIEAMAAGKPVIATRGGGVPEIVADGTGMLIPMNDAPALAKAMEEMLSNPAQAATMGRAGRAHVAQNFLIAHTAAKVCAAYNAVLGVRVPGGQ